MILIIEGLDGTGKTTLANKLFKEFRWSYLHPNDLGECNHNDWRDEFVMAYTIKHVARPGTNIVMDRSAISGLAYTYEDGGYVEAIRLFQRWLELLTICNTVVLCHLVADNETREKRDPGAIEADRKLKLSLDKLTERIAIQMPEMAYARIDTTHVPADEVFRRVEAELLWRR